MTCIVERESRSGHDIAEIAKITQRRGLKTCESVENKLGSKYR